MAKPITSTPILTIKESIEFLAVMHENEHNKIGRIPTPKLKEANELIKQHTKNAKKQIR